MRQRAGGGRESRNDPLVRETIARSGEAIFYVKT